MNMVVLQVNLEGSDGHNVEIGEPDGTVTEASGSMPTK